MRLLVVTQYFWPENFRINDLVLGLKERGHEVTVYTGKPNYPEGRFFDGYGFFGRASENWNGIRVLRVPLVPRGSGSSLRLVVNYFSFAFFASLAAPLRVREPFDAILVYEPSPVTVGLPALVVKRSRRIPVLFWVQDLWPESLAATGAVRVRWVLRAVEHLVRFIYRHCDRILVQSRAFIEPIKAFGIPEERIVYFPNSAEKLYRPVVLEPDAPEQVLVPKGFRVMFAGNIGAAQSFDTILGAAEILRQYADIHWIILGDGRLSPWVRSEVARRGLDHCVHLFGRHPAESMPRWFASADAMLVTLRRDPIFALTIPAKVQSYLACAKPIIAALEGEGARIIRESGAGIVAAAEDPGALAQAVLEVYKMPDNERREMGQRGRRYFEAHFERHRLLDRLEGWLNDLVRHSRRCAS